MKNNEVTTREKLKTYFQSGDYPTQSEFAELIDSLRHEDDVPSHRDIVNIANRLEALDSKTIEYYASDNGDLKFPIIISQEDAGDLIIEIGGKEGLSKRQKIFGKGKFIITTKEFPTGELGTNEYYCFSYYSYNSTTNSSSDMQRLFGNNLPTIPDGFAIGTMEGENSSLYIYKQDMGEKISIVNTNIQFINKTEVDVQYKIYASYWTSIYTNKDMVTDHYDNSDYLNFAFRGDLRKIELSIECKVFNTQNEELLVTANLNPLENNYQVGGNGSSGEKIRNVRIECDYV